MEPLLKYKMAQNDWENCSDFDNQYIDKVKFNCLQNPFASGLLQVRCNFDAGEIPVLCVFNPEGY